MQPQFLFSLLFPFLSRFFCNVAYACASVHINLKSESHFEFYAVGFFGNFAAVCSVQCTVSRPLIYVVGVMYDRTKVFFLSPKRLVNQPNTEVPRPLSQNRSALVKFVFTFIFRCHVMSMNGDRRHT